MEQPEQTMEQPISDNTDWQAEAKNFSLCMTEFKQRMQD